MAKYEGSNVTIARGRIERAENFYKEAQASFEKNDYTAIKPRITAARNMVDKAREALSEAQTPG